jgi:hypothetical protein
MAHCDPKKAHGYFSEQNKIDFFNLNIWRTLFTCVIIIIIILPNIEFRSDLVKGRYLSFKIIKYALMVGYAARILN